MAADSDQDDMAAQWEAALAESATTSAGSVDELFDSGGGGEVTGGGASPGNFQPAMEQVAPASFTNFTPTSSNTAGNDINMILDIPVQLTVELGRTRIPIKHILQLAQGSVIELDAMAGEPMDVLVNGYLIAQGEVVVVNDKFGIRLTDIVTPSERMRRLSKG